MTINNDPIDAPGKVDQPPPQEPQVDLAGHSDPNALAQSYRNSSREAQRQKDRADLLEQQLRNYTQPQQRSTRPEDRLSDLGIPVDALDEYVNARMQQAFAPIAKGLAARDEVMARYPDYMKYEPEVRQFLKSDPEMEQRYNNMVGADPAGALEYAILRYGDSKRRNQPEQTGSGTNKRAARDAEIPTGRSTETRSRGDANTNEDIVNQAREHYKKTGDPEPFAKSRLRQIIPDSFFEK